MLRPAATGSIARRLLVFSAVFVSAALVVAVLILWLVMQTVMRQEIDRRLDAQIDALEAALRVGPTGALSLAVPLDGPPFDRPRSGWVWQVERDGVRLASRSLGPRRLALPTLHHALQDGRHHPGRRGASEGAGKDMRSSEAMEEGSEMGMMDSPFPPWRERPGEPVPADLEGPNGTLHLRMAEREIAGRPVIIAAAAPQRALRAPALRAITWLAPCMLLLGLVLLAGTWLQIRYGLRPLTVMARDLEAVSEGLRDRLPDQTIAELMPVGAKTNALLAQNEERLSATRLHFANLAHALKTPIASLGLGLTETNDPDGTLRGLVARMDQRIRHHLAAARRAMGGSSDGVRTPLAEPLGELTAIMARLHAERRLKVTVDLAPDIAVACDGRDVEEMLGNLIDNAFKWARTRVAISAIVSGRMVLIRISDDGPGIPEARRAAVLLPGVREDERVQGHGFGLTIVKELADLYGGVLTLETSADGGLEAGLRLPLARNRPDPA